MEKQPKYSYDEEGDILYVLFYPGEKGIGIELNEQILIRIDQERNKVLSLTFFDFSVLTQMTKFGPKNFPVTGLNYLPTELQEKVIELITKPPVNQFLRLTVYSPSPTESIPKERLQWEFFIR